jgi:hypothetical protein
VRLRQAAGDFDAVVDKRGGKHGGIADFGLRISDRAQAMAGVLGKTVMLRIDRESEIRSAILNAKPAKVSWRHAKPKPCPNILFRPIFASPALPRVFQIPHSFKCAEVACALIRDPKSAIHNRPPVRFCFAFVTESLGFHSTK